MRVATVFPMLAVSLVTEFIAGAWVRAVLKSLQIAVIFLTMTETAFIAIIARTFITEFEAQARGLLGLAAARGLDGQTTRVDELAVITKAAFSLVAEHAANLVTVGIIWLTIFNGFIIVLVVVAVVASVTTTGSLLLAATVALALGAVINVFLSVGQSVGFAGSPFVSAGLLHEGLSLGFLLGAVEEAASVFKFACTLREFEAQTTSLDHDGDRLTL